MQRDHRMPIQWKLKESLRKILKLIKVLLISIESLIIEQSRIKNLVDILELRVYEVQIYIIN